MVLAKDSQVAKTRLRLPREVSRQLALGLAASTVRVALAAEEVGAVLVVTGDADIALDALQVGAEIVSEPHLLGMNRAAVLGRRRALEARPEAPVAIIVADLPGLRPIDLDSAVLEFLADGSPLFVPDHEGAGTTMLIHGPGPCAGFGFGPNSATVHQRLGYRRASRIPPSLRRDLDTAADLAAHSGTSVMAGSFDGRRHR